MSELKADRRSRRTRRLIADALLALMLEKRYDRITVQELIDRADVGRSTFYTHFRDRDDVLTSEFARVLALLHSPNNADSEGRAGDSTHGETGAHNVPRPPATHEAVISSLALFRHVAEHRRLYEALVRGRGIDLLYETGYRFLRDHAAERLARRAASLGRPAIPAVPVAVTAEYLAGALLAMLRWWLEHDTPHTPEEMDGFFQLLSAPINA